PWRGGRRASGSGAGSRWGHVSAGERIGARPARAVDVLRVGVARRLEVYLDVVRGVEVSRILRRLGSRDRDHLDVGPARSFFDDKLMIGIFEHVFLTARIDDDYSDGSVVLVDLPVIQGQVARGSRTRIANAAERK